MVASVDIPEIKDSEFDFSIQIYQIVLMVVGVALFVISIPIIVVSFTKEKPLQKKLRITKARIRDDLIVYPRCQTAAEENEMRILPWKVSRFIMSDKSNQKLPPKELGLFRKTVRHYEQKQYKMALRCTRQILANPQFAEHGETLAMRGLILNYIGKHEEALEVVRRGLTNDLKSYVCWHVFGQVQRSDKKYDEAAKAYKMALKLDNDNLQILRDLSLLQIQMRDYIGYRDSRYQLLALRPGTKAHWVAYANACHMLGDYEMAIKIIDDFIKNNTQNKAVDPEHPDLVYYKVTILVEANKLSEALLFLEQNAALLPDKLTYLETRADLLYRIGRIPAAEQVYMMLVERNPNCIDYMKRVEECKSLLHVDQPEKVKELVRQFYRKMTEKYPRNQVVKIRALLFMDKDEFEHNYLLFLIGSLRSGLPSLFNLLSEFYENVAQIAFAEKFLVDFVRKCEQVGYDKASLDGSPNQELPSTVVWVYYFLAQHFLHLKRYDIAMQYIDRAINHTPTLVDLYTMKAKIYKKSGDPKKASMEMEYAQSLDTADRYLNCKCAKYLLEAGYIDEASKMCEKFTREGMKSDDALYEMQCLWYPLACAKSFLARKEYGESLKRCHQIERILTTYYEEQYDFHTYCVRKCYVAPYVTMLHFLDEIHKNDYYVKAAKIAVRIYLTLHDHPEVLNEKSEEVPAGLTPEEQRKLRRKAARQKAQAEKAQEEKNNKQQTNKKRAELADGEFVESAPLDPKTLVSTKSPLEEATKFLHPLMLIDCNDAEVFQLAFEIYQRKGKILLMFKCLNKLIELTSNTSELEALAKKFRDEYQKSKDKCPKTVTELVDDLLPKLMPLENFTAN
ncbi:hypothetical protein M3Y98_00164700 [Aphelenchoides besseyi]|nr:hypothetical protein M3Y98_00164700 [Aphelenchoides besseyi]